MAASLSESTVFLPLQSMLGGVFIGVACGVYMIVAKRVAGNSGALKALVVGPREPTKMSFLLGLLGGGAVMASLAPTLFETPPPASPRLALAGLSVGLGVALGNGCTSGHGLCGLARCSLRSVAAVPTFMAAAMLSATLLSGASYGGFAPLGTTPDSIMRLSAKLAVALAAGLVPCFLLSGNLRETYAGLWSGGTFAVGLSIGGMVKPSVVTGALSPGLVDLTLWTLFVTGLVVTFCFYRVGVHAFGISAATALGSPQAQPDAQLLMGASLFGLGWGSSGFCPGPHLVSLPAAASAPGPALMLVCVALGMKLAKPLQGILFSAS